MVSVVSTFPLIGTLGISLFISHNSWNYINGSYIVLVSVLHPVAHAHLSDNRKPIDLCHSECDM